MEKLNAGIFDGPDITQLINGPRLIKSIQEIGSCDWSIFVHVVNTFLGKKKANDYT
jgi:hypothetical protein